MTSRGWLSCGVGREESETATWFPTGERRCGAVPGVCVMEAMIFGDMQLDVEKEEVEMMMSGRKERGKVGTVLLFVSEDSGIGYIFEFE